mmetsp:Transcript_5328/g.15637  ORF Transcript_5328/g.15637 Transcript_5328/m.15637 type:complete len:207 (+) Transcript_5328:343-963(+)
MTDEDERLVFFILLHQGGIFKSFQHRSLALDAGVRDVADLVAVERPPVLSKVALVEVQDVPVIHKVDECVSAVAAILEVDGEVEEVDHAGTVPVFVEFREQHFLGVLVGDVADHQRRSRVLPTFDELEIQRQVALVLFVGGGCGQRAHADAVAAHAAGVGEAVLVRVLRLASDGSVVGVIPLLSIVPSAAAATAAAVMAVIVQWRI